MVNFLGNYNFIYYFVTGVNFCSNIQCLNGATCQNLDTTFNCDCVLGWKGTRCETQDAGMGQRSNESS